MPVADSNPERRNLMVSSICFITYFLAGGNFSDSIVRLQVVNIEFSKPYVLAIIAWVLLFWFALRYWQVNNGELSNAYIKELSVTAHSKIAIWYVILRTGKKHKVHGGFYPQGFHINGGKLHLRYGDVEGGNEGPNGALVNFKSNNFESTPVSGFAGFMLKAYSALKLSIVKPAIGSYFVPYALFALAVLLGIYSGIL